MHNCGNVKILKLNAQPIFLGRNKTLEEYFNKKAKKLNLTSIERLTIRFEDSIGYLYKSVRDLKTKFYSVYLYTKGEISEFEIEFEKEQITKYNCVDSLVSSFCINLRPTLKIENQNKETKVVTSINEIILKLDKSKFKIESSEKFIDNYTIDGKELSQWYEPNFSIIVAPNWTGYGLVNKDLLEECKASIAPILKKYEYELDVVDFRIANERTEKNACDLELYLTSKSEKFPFISNDKTLFFVRLEIDQKNNRIMFIGITRTNKSKYLTEFQSISRTVKYKTTDN